jgi:hypothetical protein
LKRKRGKIGKNISKFEKKQYVAWKEENSRSRKRGKKKKKIFIAVVGYCIKRNMEHGLIQVVEYCFY